MINQNHQMVLAIRDSADTSNVPLVPWTIDPTSPTPSYRQLADQLRNAIRSGQINPGGKLPSTHELVTGTGLASNTVRAAVAVLREEGLVSEGVAGRGVFVLRRPLNQSS